MTEQKVIETLEYIRYCNEYKGCAESIALDMAIKSMEKQIPKPVLVKDKTYYKDYFCPVCKKQQKDTRKNKREGCYCERCGQKVDWSEEE